MTGIVFDIQRFALHDGPGIRTTVFLKGCPLHCLWCHNPESQAGEQQVSFNASLCRLDNGCSVSCPAGAYRKEDGTLAIDFSSSCSSIEGCPYGALTLIGASRSVDDVLAEVERDRKYYERSGGGLTVSGGEPLAQFEFTLALLKAARARGLHTCLDTSGMASQNKIAAVRPYVDLFLYDYKTTLADEHKRWTGATNAPVIRNLDYLYLNGASILLRCPLVPGFNDTTEHLEGIAAICHRYPDLAGIEIMPYHNMGRDKAVRIGLVYPMNGLPTADEPTKMRWLETFRSLGCEKIRLG